MLRAFEAMFKRWLRGYEVTLDLALKYRFATLLVMIGTLVGTVWLYIVIPKGFFPIEDTGFLNVVTEGPSDISFSAMTARTRQVADIMLKDPAVDYLNITTGVGGANATGNFGRALVVLKPRDQREDIGTVVQRLRVKANSLVGVSRPISRSCRTSILAAGLGRACTSTRSNRAIPRPSTRLGRK